MFGEELKDIINHPTPSANVIPNWYKKMPRLIGSSRKDGLSEKNNNASNATVKQCSPFLDALTFGYMYSLPIDIEFVKDENNNIKINWRSNHPFVTEHSTDQHPNFPPAIKEMNFILKWTFPFVIETPPGYSCFFTHPLNRHDLPFRTFSGIVETDLYPNAVQFPFHLSSDFEERLIVEKGTPICQIFPFKTENWESIRENMTIEEEKRRMFQLMSKIVKSYKYQWWRKKTYT